VSGSLKKEAGKEGAAQVSVRILEKEFLIACPHEERAALLDAAELLNRRMRDIRETGKVIGYDRIAVMAALNLANDLLRVETTDRKTDEQIIQRIKALRERIDGAVERSKQLEL
jgi:cell division protein ZapA